MSCERCGEEESAHVDFPSNFTAELCKKCINDYYEKLRDSPLHDECIRLDALGEYLEGLAVAGRPPSFETWHEYHKAIAKSDKALYLAAREFLVN